MTDEIPITQDVYSVKWKWSVYYRNEVLRQMDMKYATITEQDWLSKHQNLLKCLVMEKFKGDASSFALDVSEERVQRNVNTRLPVTGNRNVDAAVNLIQGGVDVWNTIQGRGARDSLAWGADS